MKLRLNSSRTKNMRLRRRKARELDTRAERCHFLFTMSQNKLEDLRNLLRSFGSCLIAYSGGVDSAFLTVVAHQVLGEKSLAVIADSPSLARRELDEAVKLAEKFGFALRIIHPHEFENAEYLSNPHNRCYFCKHELFKELTPIAKKEGFGTILHGENASDIGDYRPGGVAANEFKVRAPLREVGLTKAEIRQYSEKLGLPTAWKPQAACLSSRIPYGESVTVEKIAMIEKSEYILQDLGFHDVRVRHHELPGTGKKRYLARIEIGTGEMPAFMKKEVFDKVLQELKKLGYMHVTLDLEGYRRGGFNRVIGKS